jgi:hypothetical protein
VSCGLIFHGSHYIEGWVSGQQLVALSSGEAEFYALGKTVAHLLFFVYLLRELQVVKKAHCLTDSSAARGMACRTGPGRVKHLETRWLWIQERVREKSISLGKVDTKVNPADLGTKVLDGETVRRLCRICRLGEGEAKKAIKCLLFAVLTDRARAQEEISTMVIHEAYWAVNPYGVFLSWRAVLELVFYSLLLVGSIWGLSFGCRRRRERPRVVAAVAAAAATTAAAEELEEIPTEEPESPEQQIEPEGEVDYSHETRYPVRVPPEELPYWDGVAAYRERQRVERAAQRERERVEAERLRAAQREQERQRRLAAAARSSHEDRPVFMVPRDMYDEIPWPEPPLPTPNAPLQQQGAYDPLTVEEAWMPFHIPMQIEQRNNAVPGSTEMFLMRCYSAMTLVKMKERCRIRGLPVSGSKTDLSRRLIASDAAAGATRYDFGAAGDDTDRPTRAQWTFVLDMCRRRSLEMPRDIMHSRAAVSAWLTRNSA